MMNILKLMLCCFEAGLANETAGERGDTDSQAEVQGVRTMHFKVQSYSIKAALKSFPFKRS